MDNNKLTALAHLYMQGKATEEEKRQLHEWYDGINKDGDDEEVIVTNKTESENETGERILNSLRQKIGFKEAPIVPIYRNRWKRGAAAAAVLLMISVGGYLIFKKKENQDIAKTEPQEKRFKNDVAAPTKVKATITLADGRVVGLDSITNGTLATQGNVNVIKTADGKIIYNGSSTEVVYNTLTNPKGSLVIDMTLADGSRIWLNAESSVTYPVAFTGNERKVAITGEAYFEIKHLTPNPSPKAEGGKGSIPFLVEANGTITEVLGTHFNVNSYSDEANVKITLLEGSVKVSKGSSSGLLKPGQQAQVSSEVKIVNDVDVDAVMAWKNGLFRFKDATIEPIMRQVEKWYDVDVVFEDKVTEHFITTIPRNVPVTQVFKYLETTGRVHFKIDGRKVTVLK